MHHFYPNTMQGAADRRADEEAEKGERDLREADRARVLWPLIFRDEVVAALRQQAEWNADVVRQINAAFDKAAERYEGLRVAHNGLNAIVTDLREELATERKARMALEAIPRQTLNLTLPERQITVDVPPPNVTVEIPARTTVSEVVERDDKGRIKRTVSTEKPASP